MTSSNVDLKQQLKRQLSFLESSSLAYDNGVYEEALRIAVSLRVLFHDTNRSISLLQHMGMKNNVQLGSTANNIDQSLFNGQDIVTLIPLIFGSEISYQKIEFLKKLSIDDWWNEPVFYQGILLSRKDVVLSSANQDGGAHVDVSPDHKTLSLIKPFFIKSTIVNGAITSKENIGNHHFPLLRQFAYEALNSKELMDLAI